MTDRATIRTDQVCFPVGWLDISWSDAGIHGVAFAEQRARRRAGRKARFLDTEFGSAFERYFAGRIGALEHLPVVLDGTAFQLKVWHALRQIAPGHSEAYGELAARIGHPGASRAVGSANGKNPISIVIPCHRVIGAGRRLAGYGGGIDKKRWLLTHEGVEFND